MSMHMYLYNHALMLCIRLGAYISFTRCLPHVDLAGLAYHLRQARHVDWVYGVKQHEKRIFRSTGASRHRC